MRSILVPVADHAHTDAVFQAALMLARQFDSYVEGLAIGPDLSGLAGFEIPMGGPMPDETMWRDLAEQAREQFETFMSAHLPPPPRHDRRLRLVGAKVGRRPQPRELRPRL